jgi:hypothetical protein
MAKPHVQTLSDRNLKSKAQELYGLIQIHFSQSDLELYGTVTSELSRRGYEIQVKKQLAFKRRPI